MKGRTLRCLTLFVLLSFLLMALSCAPVEDKPKGDLKAATFTLLQTVKNEKKASVVAYLNNLKVMALATADDKKLLNAFRYFKDNESSSNEKLEYDLDRHYVENYSDFYDMLFIDRDGYIFHTIKKEADYKKNIYRDGLDYLAPFKQALLNEREAFMEYRYYLPSDEPAAFFVWSGIKGTWLGCFFSLLTSLIDLN